MFKSLNDTQVTYKEAKSINKDYNSALTQFLFLYSDWLRTDSEKHYNFKLDNQ